MEDRPTGRGEPPSCSATVPSQSPSLGNIRASRSLQSPISFMPRMGRKPRHLDIQHLDESDVSAADQVPHSRIGQEEVGFASFAPKITNKYNPSRIESTLLNRKRPLPDLYHLDDRGALF